MAERGRVCGFSLPRLFLTTRLDGWRISECNGWSEAISSTGVIVSREFSVLIERDEDGFYVGSVPSLVGCYTQARSLDELLERIQETIALCLEDETEAKSVPALEFIGVQRVRVPA